MDKTYAEECQPLRYLWISPRAISSERWAVHPPRRYAAIRELRGAER